MFTTTIFFIMGFIVLVKGADLLVDGSSSIAKRYNISSLVIGLTIVAFGTSFPELIVSTLAAVRGSSEIAIGNSIGSNISNTLLILGVCSVIYPIVVKKNTITKEIPFSLLAVFVLGIMVNDVLIDKGAESVLSRIDGLVMILFFSIFIFYTFGISKVEEGIMDSLHEKRIKEYSFFVSVILILFGLVGLYFGGEWIVNGAIFFAKTFGVSEALIALTITAIGTSLPELAASAMAAYRGNADIAIGNVVGSNIFNILWVLGMSAILKPIYFPVSLNLDIVILFIITILLYFLIYLGKRNILSKWEGLSLLFLYFGYLIFLIIRG